VTVSSLVDYHVHSKWCGHATGELDEYVEAAIACGLAEIGLSEHLPIPIPTDEKINLTAAEMETWVRQVHDARDRYRGDIVVRLGGECDFIPGQEAAIAALIGRYPFDYVIGSVHFLGDWGFDNPRQMHVYDQRDLMQVYAEYFSVAAAAAESGFFDVLGHADLVKKFGFRPKQDYSHLLEGLAETLAAAGMCVEVNTAGMDKPVGEIYPGEPLMRELAARDVPVTLGSDAHAPAEVGRYFGQAVPLMKRCGFAELSRFERRRRFTTPLCC